MLLCERNGNECRTRRSSDLHHYGVSPEEDGDALRTWRGRSVPGTSHSSLSLVAKRFIGEGGSFLSSGRDFLGERFVIREHFRNCISISAPPTRARPPVRV